MTIKQLRAALEDNLSAAIALASCAPVGYSNTEITASPDLLNKLDKQIKLLTRLQQNLTPVSQTKVA